MTVHHHEKHYTERASWLRAAVLGANDGLVSIGSLLVGIGMASSTESSVLLTGLAGLVAGAMSMAAGEYVSVSSQRDLETADLDTERRALRDYPKEEQAELADIYVQRGLTPELAQEVARQLTAHDALGAHARDELQIVAERTRPLGAAFSSAAAFAGGGGIPLVTALLLETYLAAAVTVAVAIGLTGLGIASAMAGGAPVGRAVARVVIWGLLAMAVTGGVGWAVGVGL